MGNLFAYLREKIDTQSRLLLKNTSWILGSNIIRSGLVFARSIVVAKCLGLELYGVYAIIASFVMAMQDFFNLNVGNAFIKYGAEFRSDKRIDKMIALMKSCFYATLITASLSLVVTWAVVQVAYDSIFDKPGLQWLVVLFALSDVATFFDPVGKSFLRLYYKFKVNAIVQTLTSVVEFAILCLVVFLNPQNLAAFIAAVCIVRLTNLAINYGVVYYELRSEIRPYLRTPITVLSDRKKEIFHFVIGNSLSKTLMTAINQGDTFLIGSMAGAAMAAYYNVAKKLASMLSVIADPFTLSIYPQLSNLVAERKVGEIKTMLLKIMRTTALPATAIVLAVLLLNQWLVGILYGADFLPAAGILQVSIVTAMITAVFFWNQGILLSLGLIRFRFFVYLFALIGGIALAWVLVPRWQAIGMAYTVLAVKTATILIFSITAFNKLNELTNDTPVETENTPS